MRIEKGVNLMKKSIENSDELNKRRMEFFKLNTSSIAEERYLCTICSKVTKITLNLQMFKGPNFVHNHIINKHMALVEDNVDKEVGF